MNLTFISSTVDNPGGQDAQSPSLNLSCKSKSTQGTKYIYIWIQIQTQPNPKATLQIKINQSRTQKYLTITETTTTTTILTTRYRVDRWYSRVCHKSLSTDSQDMSISPAYPGHLGLVTFCTIRSGFDKCLPSYCHDQSMNSPDRQVARTVNTRYQHDY